jgi:hypothetical protein
MPIPPHYSTETCNIPTCESEIAESLLCAEHYARYVTDDRSRELFEFLSRRASGALTRDDKRKLGRAVAFHYASAQRVPLAEHFACESLFLHHLELLKTRYPYFHRGVRAPEDVSDEDLGLIVALDNDFAHAMNAHEHETYAFRQWLSRTFELPDIDLEFNNYFFASGIFPRPLVRAITVVAISALALGALLSKLFQFELPLVAHMEFWQAISLAILVPVLNSQLHRFGESIML